MIAEPWAKDFAETVRRPDERVNLPRAALLIARHTYPDLDVECYLRRLDDYAAAMRQRLGGNHAAQSIVGELNAYLYDELGFAGNVVDFQDPRNSLFNDVLDRRLGIPITLAILYWELGQRLGLPVVGVSFPGHFLVKFPVYGGEVVLDPFSHGVSLTKEALCERLERVAQMQGRATPQLAEALRRATRVATIERMLRNLRAIYVQRGALEKALAMVEHILVLNPGSPPAIRERGRIYQQMGCFRKARTDYLEYLQRVTEPADEEEVRAELIRITRSVARLH